MAPNLGKTDRMIRFIVGLVILVLGIIFQSWWGLVGLVILATAAASRCLLYVPFKWNTLIAKKAG